MKTNSTVSVLIVDCVDETTEFVLAHDHSDKKNTRYLACSKVIDGRALLILKCGMNYD